MLSDIALFLLIYVSCIVSFLITHTFLFRIIHPRNPLKFIIGVTLGSIMAVSLFCAFFLSHFFSRFGIYILANLAAALAALFTCGLYSFLVPITAERSTAAQMIIFLYETQKLHLQRER